MLQIYLHTEKHLSFCGSNDLHMKIFHNHLTTVGKIEKLLATDG